MYDRYTIYSTTESLKDALKVEDIPDRYKPSYNAAPTQLLPIISNENRRGISFFHWGLMTKWSNNKTSISVKSINVTAKTAFQQTGYKNRIKLHRCIVPINGFYVWKRVSKKQRVPYYYFSTQFPILGISGLWEEFEDIDGTISHSYIIMTVPSSPSLIEFETQMPAILEPNDCVAWLGEDNLVEHERLILSITKDHPALTFHSVSPSISQIDINSPALIDAVPASDQLGNYTLFS